MFELASNGLDIGRLLNPYQIEEQLGALQTLAPVALLVLDRGGDPLVIMHPKGRNQGDGSVLMGLLEGRREEIGPLHRRPIHVHSECIGEVIVVSLDPQQAPAETVAAIAHLAERILADQAYKEHELNSLTTELLDKYEEITLLYDVSQTLSSVFDIAAICDIALDKALHAVRAEKAFVALANEKDRVLTVRAERGMPDFLDQSFSFDKGVSGLAASEARQIILRAGEPSPAPFDMERASTEAILSTPLILNDKQTDRILGVMTLIGKPAGEIFTAGEAKLLNTIANQAAIAIHHSRLVDALRETERVRQEMEIAARIQQSLLPDRPPAVRGLELVGRCVSATNVGGDYYDFLTDDAGRVYLLIADVSGHSVGSALMMAMARSVLRREIREQRSPAAVLAYTNEAMLSDLINAGLFITLFCARYDPAYRVLTFANGGHNPPLLWRAASQSMVELDGDGLIIGIMDGIEYEERTVPLEPGDVLTLYTDGVIEARNPQGEQFGEERLRRIIADYSSASPHELAEAIYAAVTRHRQDNSQQDDITLVIMKIMEET